MREFKVQKGVRGYVVWIGCQVAGFSNEDDLLAAIQEYVKDPEATEKKYYSNTCGEGRPNGIGLDERLERLEMPTEAPEAPPRTN